MKCPKCQHDNPSDALFCNKCGNKLEIVCTACGKTNPDEAAPTRELLPGARRRVTKKLAESPVGVIDDTGRAKT